MTGEQEQCDDDLGGFVWAAVGASEVAPRLRDAGAAMARLLRSGEEATTRPTPDVWSPIEHACHVRDVLLNLRDRAVAAQALHEAQHNVADISRAVADAVARR